MKLLIFSPYYPPHIGGLESHADEFNKYLSQKGVDITVFTPRLPVNAKEFEILHDNVKVFRFPAFEIIPNYPLPKFWKITFWKLFLGLYKNQVDTTISRTRFFVTAILAFVFSKTKGTKWIHIEHGSDFVQLSSKCKSLIAKIYDLSIGRIIFKSSDINISISQAVQKFVSLFDKRHSPIIYRGLDLKFIDKIEPNLALKEKYRDKIIISFVGRLYKWKGVEKSIQSIIQLPKETKDRIIFLIIGNGEDFCHLKKISNKESCIQLLGKMPREEAISILKISDIYIHSAFPGGGLSTSLLEAMYCKNLVIASPNEGANECISNDHNGFLLENNSIDSIKNAVMKYFELTNKHLLTTNAKRSIDDNFNWHISIEKYLNILNISK